MFGIWTMPQQGGMIILRFSPKSVFQTRSPSSVPNIVVVLRSSVVSDSLWPHGQWPPGFPVLHHLLDLAQIHVHWVSDAIQPSLLSPSPPVLNLSQHQGLFQWVGSSIRWPNYWSFSFSISFSSEYSGLISFKIDWFDPLEVQETLKHLLQHATVQKHQFFRTRFSLWSNSHIHTWLLEKP